MRVQEIVGILIVLLLVFSVYLEFSVSQIKISADNVSMEIADLLSYVSDNVFSDIISMGNRFGCKYYHMSEESVNLGNLTRLIIVVENAQLTIKTDFSLPSDKASLLVYAEKNGFFCKKKAIELGEEEAFYILGEHGETITKHLSFKNGIIELSLPSLKGRKIEIISNSSLVKVGIVETGNVRLEARNSVIEFEADIARYNWSQTYLEADNSVVSASFIGNPRENTGFVRIVSSNSFVQARLNFPSVCVVKENGFNSFIKSFFPECNGETGVRTIIYSTNSFISVGSLG